MPVIYTSMSFLVASIYSGQPYAIHRHTVALLTRYCKGIHFIIILSHGVLHIVLTYCLNTLHIHIHSHSYIITCKLYHIIYSYFFAHTLCQDVTIIQMQCRAGFDLFLMRLHTLGMRYTITPVSKCIYDCINKYFKVIKKGRNSESQVCISHKLINESIQLWQANNNNNNKSKSNNRIVTASAISTNTNDSDITINESYNDSIIHDIDTEDLRSGQNYDPSCPIIRNSADFCVLKIFKN